MHNNIDVLQSKMQIEIRTTVQRFGRPKLVGYNDRYSHTGFTSVYGFPPEAVARINSSGTLRNLSDFPVFSDVLYVDFDNNEEAAERFRLTALEGKCGYEMYHSGGRSIHFHIPLEPMYGRGVPGSQRVWMEEKAPEADMSIYRHTGLYRLPGTRHDKNPGKSKKILLQKDGPLLRIENRPHVRSNLLTEDGSGVEFHYRVLGRLLHMRVAEGGRHTHLFKIGMNCLHSGQPEAEARNLLNMWNNSNCHPPKQDWELERIINYVYNQGGNK